MYFKNKRVSAKIDVTMGRLSLTMGLTLKVKDWS